MITARIEKNYRKSKSGKVFGPYYYSCLYVGGLRIRKYLKITNTPANNWSFKECHYSAWLCKTAKENKRWVENLKRNNRKRPGQGRKSFYPKPVINILQEMGYRIRGKEIQINRKLFFKYETVCLRFAMLDDRNKELIGSPENLLQVTKDAFSCLKASNRKKQKKTFEECFQIAFQEFKKETH